MKKLYQKKQNFFLKQEFLSSKVQFSQKTTDFLFKKLISATLALNLVNTLVANDISNTTEIDNTVVNHEDKLYGIYFNSNSTTQINLNSNIVFDNITKEGFVNTANNTFGLYFEQGNLKLNSSQDTISNIQIQNIINGAYDLYNKNSTITFQNTSLTFGEQSNTNDSYNAILATRSTKLHFDNGSSTTFDTTISHQKAIGINSQNTTTLTLDGATLNFNKLESSTQSIGLYTEGSGNLTLDSTNSKITFNNLTSEGESIGIFGNSITLDAKNNSSLTFGKIHSNAGTSTGVKSNNLNANLDPTSQLTFTSITSEKESIGISGIDSSDNDTIAFKGSNGEKAKITFEKIQGNEKSQGIANTNLTATNMNFTFSNIGGSGNSQEAIGINSASLTLDNSNLTFTSIGSTTTNIAKGIAIDNGSKNITLNNNSALNFASIQGNNATGMELNGTLTSNNNTISFDSIQANEIAKGIVVGSNTTINNTQLTFTSITSEKESIGIAGIDSSGNNSIAFTNNNGEKAKVNFDKITGNEKSQGITNTSITATNIDLTFKDIGGLKEAIGINSASLTLNNSSLTFTSIGGTTTTTAKGIAIDNSSRTISFDANSTLSLPNIISSGESSGIAGVDSNSNGSIIFEGNSSGKTTLTFEKIQGNEKSQGIANTSVIATNINFTFSDIGSQATSKEAIGINSASLTLNNSSLTFESIGGITTTTAKGIAMDNSSRTISFDENSTLSLPSIISSGESSGIAGVDSNSNGSITFTSTKNGKTTLTFDKIQGNEKSQGIANTSVIATNMNFTFSDIGSQATSKEAIGINSVSLTLSNSSLTFESIGGATTTTAKGIAMDNSSKSLALNENSSLSFAKIQGDNATGMELKNTLTSSGGNINFTSIQANEIAKGIAVGSNTTINNTQLTFTNITSEKESIGIAGVDSNSNGSITFEGNDTEKLSLNFSKITGETTSQGIANTSVVATKTNITFSDIGNSENSQEAIGINSAGLTLNNSSLSFAAIGNTTTTAAKGISINNSKTIAFNNSSNSTLNFASIQGIDAIGMEFNGTFTNSDGNISFGPINASNTAKGIVVNSNIIFNNTQLNFANIASDKESYGITGIDSNSNGTINFNNSNNEDKAINFEKILGDEKSQGIANTSVLATKTNITFSDIGSSENSQEAIGINSAGLTLNNSNLTFTAIGNTTTNTSKGITIDNNAKNINFNNNNSTLDFTNIQGANTTGIELKTAFTSSGGNINFASIQASEIAMGIMVNSNNATINSSSNMHFSSIQGKKAYGISLQDFAAVTLNNLTFNNDNAIVIEGNEESIGVYSQGNVTFNSSNSIFGTNAIGGTKAYGIVLKEGSTSTISGLIFESTATEASNAVIKGSELSIGILANNNTSLDGLNTLRFGSNAIKHNATAYGIHIHDINTTTMKNILFQSQNNGVIQGGTESIGISLQDSNTITLENITFSSNAIISDKKAHGIVFNDSTTTINNLVFGDGTTVAIRGGEESVGFVLKGNSVSLESNNITIKTNAIAGKNIQGIYVSSNTSTLKNITFSDNALNENNVVADSKKGIYITSSSSQLNLENIQFGTIANSEDTIGLHNTSANLSINGKNITFNSIIATNTANGLKLDATTTFNALHSTFGTIKSNNNATGITINNTTLTANGETEMNFQNIEGSQAYGIALNHDNTTTSFSGTAKSIDFTNITATDFATGIFMKGVTTFDNTALNTRFHNVGGANASGITLDNATATINNLTFGGEDKPIINGNEISAGIYAKGTSTLTSGETLKFNPYSIGGVKAYGIALDNTTATINDLSFGGEDKPIINGNEISAGIYAKGASTLTSGATLKFNPYSIGGTKAYGIALDNTTATINNLTFDGDDKPIINGNEISAGIYAKGVNTLTSENGTINFSNNAIRSNSKAYGIYLDNGSENTIKNISFTGETEKAVVQGNDIRGIYLATSSVANFENITFNDNALYALIPTQDNPSNPEETPPSENSNSTRNSKENQSNNTPTYGYGVYLENNTKANFKDVSFENNTYATINGSDIKAIYIQGQSTINEAQDSMLNFKSNAIVGEQYAYGIYLDKNSNATINHINFSSQTEKAVVQSNEVKGIYLATSSVANFENITFGSNALQSLNTIQDNPETGEDEQPIQELSYIYGIYLESESKINFKNSTFESQTSSVIKADVARGIYFAGKSAINVDDTENSQLTFGANAILGEQYAYGIYLDNNSNATINNLTFKSEKDIVIQGDDARGIYIVGNSSIDGSNTLKFSSNSIKGTTYTHGIFLSSKANAAVKNIVFEGENAAAIQGNDARGIYIKNSSKANLENITFNDYAINGVNAYGIYTNNELTTTFKNVTFQGKDHASISGDNASGIYAASISVLDGGGELSFNDNAINGVNAYGINLAKSSNTIVKNVNFKSTETPVINGSKTSAGIYTQRAATTTLENINFNDNSIGGANAYGIHIGSNSRTTIKNLTFSGQNDSVIHGNEVSAGIYTENNSTLNGSNSLIFGKNAIGGVKSYGIYAGSNSQAVVKNLVFSGDSIVVQGRDITAGIYAEDNSTLDGGNSLIFGKNAIGGNNTYGIYFSGSNTETYKSSTIKNIIFMGDDTPVIINEDAKGVYLANTANLTLENAYFKTNTILNNNNAYGIYLENKAKLVAKNIVFDSDNSVISGNNTTGIYVNGLENTLIVDSLTLQGIVGKSNKTYGIYVNTDSTLELSIGKNLSIEAKYSENSLLKEAPAFAFDSTSNQANSIIATMSPNATLTLHTQGGIINQLNGNRGIITFGDDTKKRTYTQENSKLILRSLAINDMQLKDSTFKLLVSDQSIDIENGFDGRAIKDLDTLKNISTNQADYATQAGSDRIIIQGTNTPSKVPLNNMLEPVFENAEKIDKETHFVLAEVAGEIKDKIIFNKLEENNATTIVESAIGFDAVTSNLLRKDLDDKTYYLLSLRDSRISEVSKSGTQTGIGLNYYLYLANLNSLNKRMGELRENANAQGIWARVFNGMQTSNFEAQTKTLYTTFQAGYDYALGMEGANNYIGFAISYANAINKINLNQSSSSILSTFKNNISNGVEFAIYNAYIQDGASSDTGFKNGLYSDTIFKFSFINNNLSFNNEQNYSVNNFALTLSQELGYQFLFGENKIFFLDPQAEISLGFLNQSNLQRVLGNSYLKGIQDSIFTLRGRVGSNLGFNLDKSTEDNKIRSQIYLGTYFVGDFISGGDIKFNTNTGNTDFMLSPLASTTRFTLNIGTNFSFKNHHRIYLDFERSFGGRIITEYQINFGYRYSFGENEKYMEYGN